jgi:hypothetical protein
MNELRVDGPSELINVYGMVLLESRVKGGDPRAPVRSPIEHHTHQ